MHINPLFFSSCKETLQNFIYISEIIWLAAIDGKVWVSYRCIKCTVGCEYTVYFPISRRRYLQSHDVANNQQPKKGVA